MTFTALGPRKAELLVPFKLGGASPWTQLWSLLNTQVVSSSPGSLTPALPSRVGGTSEPRIHPPNFLPEDRPEPQRAGQARGQRDTAAGTPRADVLCLVKHCTLKSRGRGPKRVTAPLFLPFGFWDDRALQACGALYKGGTGKGGLRALALGCFSASGVTETQRTRKQSAPLPSATLGVHSPARGSGCWEGAQPGCWQTLPHVAVPSGGKDQQSALTRGSLPLTGHSTLPGAWNKKRLAARAVIFHGP